MKKRVFAAIEVPTEFRKIITKYNENLKRDFSNLKISWEKEEKLHITIKFLGEIDEKQLHKLNEIINKIAQITDRFKLSITKTDVFGSKILNLAISDNSQSLLKINNLLETKCEQIGIEKEKRKFSPHITLARIREPNAAKQLVKQHLRNEIEPMEFEVSEIVIYESVLHPKGSIYRKIASMKLF